MQRVNIIRNHFPDIANDLLTFTATQENSSVSMFTVGLPPEISLEYTQDGHTWIPYIFNDVEEDEVVVSREGDTISLPNIGDKVSFRAVSSNSSFCDFNGQNSKYYDPIAYYRWSFTGEIAASGLLYYLVWRNGKSPSASSSLPKGAFFSMFKDCTNLITAPYIGGKVKRVGCTDRCFSHMFQGCTSLVSCYWDEEFNLGVEANSFTYMFYGCTSLVETSDIITYGNVYQTSINFEYMFYGCTSYTHPIKIRMGNEMDNWLKNNCYAYTFCGCSAIEDLSGVIVYNWVQDFMCKDCTPLKKIPTAKGMILGQGTFQGCTSIECHYITSRNHGLRGTENMKQHFMNSGLKDLIYDSDSLYCIMYNSNVDFAYTKFKPILDYYKAGNTANWYSQSSFGDNGGSTQDWLYGVPAKGTLFARKGFENINTSSSLIPSGWNINEIDDRPLCFEAETPNFQIGLMKYGEIQDEPFQYSTDGTNWQDVKYNEFILLENIGDKIYFRNIRKDSTTSLYKAGGTGYYRFSTTNNNKNGKIKCTGNMLSMLRYMGAYTGAFVGQTYNNDLNYMLYGLFGSMYGTVTTFPTLPDYGYLIQAQCLGLIYMSNAPNLTNVTLEFKKSTIGWNAFYRTFQGASNLKTAYLKIRTDRFTNNPSGAFYQLFNGCTSLEKLGVYFDIWGRQSNGGLITGEWLINASTNGTFICPKGLDTSIRDVSHIPSGWTIKYWYQEMAEQYPKDPNEDPTNPTTVAGLMEKYSALEDIIDTYPDIAPILNQYPNLVHSLVNTGYKPYMVAHGDIWETECMLTSGCSVSFSFEKVNQSDCIGVGCANSCTEWQSRNSVFFANVTDPTPTDDDYTNTTHTRYFYMGFTDHLPMQSYNQDHVPIGKHTVTLGNTDLHYSDITLDGVSSPSGTLVKGNYSQLSRPLNLYINAVRFMFGYSVTIQQMFDKFYQSDAKYYDITVYNGDTLAHKFVPIADGVFADIADLDNIKIIESTFNYSDIFNSGVESRSSVFGIEAIETPSE